MSQNVDRKLKHVATWWQATGSDGFGGVTYNTPVKIKCRWEEHKELVKSVDETHEYISNAKVYVDREMDIDDILALGDHSGINNPNLVSGSFKVRRFDRLTDLRNVSELLRVIL